MNERQERIERLAERWFAAQATDAEERELRDWFRQAAGVPDSLREAQILFGGLDALAGERSRERWKPRRAGRILPLWGIAAAVVIGLFVCADLLRKPYCYIDGVAVYDVEFATADRRYHCDVVRSSGEVLNFSYNAVTSGDDQADDGAAAAFFAAVEEP